MNKKIIYTCLIILLLLILIFLYLYFDIGQYLILENIKSRRNSLVNIYLSNKFEFIIAYVLIYVLITTPPVPGAAVLTLIGGAVFGTLIGTLIVAFASTISATLGFLASRFLFRDRIEKNYPEKLKKFNKGIEENGINYILFLRFISILPFFLINIVMGLTRITIRSYFWGSWIGMIPGTFVYAYAGNQLAAITSLNDIMTPGVLSALAGLGIFALLPIFYKKYKKHKIKL